jgi:peptide/nickel transport system substrate-binding protein
LLRRLAVTSLGFIFFLAAARVETARRPQYGGVLRIEIAASVNSLEPATAAMNPEESAVKAQLDALIYERRNPDGTFSGVAGSGPFQVVEWEAGKQATLKANDNAPGGRPFVDSIEILMGREAEDRLVDLDLGKTDLAEIPVEQVRRAADRGLRVSMSRPDELMALIFPAGRKATENARVREGLADSIDRASIVNFILQKNGEAAGGLLPRWSSGMAFLFSTAADAGRAKELWAQIPGSPKLLLGYDSGDPLEQSVAERIVVNAREAGISVKVQAIPEAEAATAGPSVVDARLVRLRMPSPLPRVALTNFIAVLGPMAKIDASPLPEPASPQDIYDRERAIVSSYRVVPLVWLPQVYGLSARVRNWKAPGPGEAWPLADVWLDAPAEAVSEGEKQ